MSDYYIYRKYRNYPMIRRRVYRFRMNHDVWAWVLVALTLAGFILMEVTR